jgi:hypothetical protein
MSTQLKLLSLLERRANVREENSPLIEPEGRRDIYKVWSEEKTKSIWRVNG